MVASTRKHTHDLVSNNKITSFGRHSQLNYSNFQKHRRERFDEKLFIFFALRELIKTMGEKRRLSFTMRCEMQLLLLFDCAGLPPSHYKARDFNSTENNASPSYSPNDVIVYAIFSRRTQKSLIERDINTACKYRRDENLLITRRHATHQKSLTHRNIHLCRFCDGRIVGTHALPKKNTNII